MEKSISVLIHSPSHHEACLRASTELVDLVANSWDCDLCFMLSAKPGVHCAVRRRWQHRNSFEITKHHRLQPYRQMARMMAISMTRCLFSRLDRRCTDQGESKKQSLAADTADRVGDVAVVPRIKLGASFVIWDARLRTVIHVKAKEDRWLCACLTEPRPELI